MGFCPSWENEASQNWEKAPANWCEPDLTDNEHKQLWVTNRHPCGFNAYPCHGADSENIGMRCAHVRKANGPFQAVRVFKFKNRSVVSFGLLQDNSKRVSSKERPVSIYNIGSIRLTWGFMEFPDRGMPKIPTLVGFVVVFGFLPSENLQCTHGK